MTHHTCSMARVVVLLSSLCALWLTQGTRANAQTTTATTTTSLSGQIVFIENGPVSGTVTADGRKFLGIPYAKPPVGALRWKAPVAPANWTTIRDATKFGSACPQNPSPFGVPSTNEDCLFVNVYTPPAGLLRKDPVLVWIHPGAFLSGTGNDFDPKQFVKKNLVVVTLNYRLGALGWLAHPSLTTEGSGSSGNYGLFDQQAVLRWVKKNISKFGGDPDKVTIAGESAGGVSVHAHMVSPGSAGKFQRAIVQSGTYTLTPPTVAASEPFGTTFAGAVGCASGDLACLRAVPVATVLASQGTNINAFVPRVDGSTLPRTFLDAFKTGQFNRVSVLEGNTHDEFTLFVSLLFTLQNIPINATTYPGAIAALLGLQPPVADQVVPLIIQQYPLANYPKPELALAAVGTDAVFACTTHAATQLLTLWVQLWRYEFDDPDAPQLYLPPVPYPYGAYHGSELQYLFDVREPIPGDLNTSQKQLSDAMVTHWSNFVRLGNPNTVPTVWQRYQPPLLDRVQLLTPPQPQAYTGTTFATDHKCAFWTALSSGGS